MAHDMNRASNCAAGDHRARRTASAGADGTVRSRCRDCGCALMRTQATRRWFFSGTLGLESRVTRLA